MIKMLEKYDSYNICAECEILRPMRSKHCDVCNKCVKVYDHHCPWINNCVGANNYRFYCVFIVSTIITLLAIIALNGYSFTLNYKNLDNEHC